MTKLIMFLVLVLSSLLLGYELGQLRSQDEIEVRIQNTEYRNQKSEVSIQKSVVSSLQQSAICNLKSPDTSVGIPSTIRKVEADLPMARLRREEIRNPHGRYLKGYLYQAKKDEALSDIFKCLWDSGWRFGAESKKEYDQAYQRFIDRVTQRIKLKDNRLLADGVIDFSPEKKPSDKDYRKRFINKVSQHIKQLDTQVPAELIIAQACLETGYGKSEQYKNLFCMTGTGPAGYYRHGDHDYVKGKKIYRIKKFKAYHTYEQSINDLVNWYEERNLVANGQLDNILVGLSRSGYASDPNYTSKIRGIIRKYDL